MTKLTTMQSAILVDLFDQLPVGDEVDTLDFSLSGNFSGKFCAAYAEIENIAEKAFVVFTLPTYTNHVFMGVTKANELTVARMLANLEDYEREHSLQLSLGEVVVIPNYSDGSEGYPHALLLTKTTTSVDLENVPDLLRIQQKEIKCFCVIPLSEKELNIRNTHGHDALIDHFVEQDKSLFFFTG